MTGLVKRDPFVGGLFRDFDNIFDGFFGRPRNPVAYDPWRTSTYIKRTGILNEVKEEDNYFLITIDVPGFAKEDLSVYVLDGTLHIDGKIEDGDGNVTRSIKRSYTLSDICAQEGVGAECKNGVLTVTVPKIVVKEAEKRIEVEIT